ncbi:hypothetical protein WJ74_02910 [Burkholderia ubonensis]|uniref:hypothetical protein n=1 Tax=Burkholderia ubonensis TaxID=101571 RepID=UPI0007597788|nr:hypothetical protein [Burkholderia ubonensis]KVO21404.1 hypothetical protein WJ74_02910 [Burkholderia ubonensis]KVO42174.1 hypothetical protein WJ75_05505 [Burkholderia ubonensis]
MDQDAIKFSLFDPKKLRKAADAIRDQPRLTCAEFQKLEHDQKVLHARFDELAKMMQPLEESYVRARRKLGPKPYDPTTDKALQDVNQSGLERMRELRSQLEQGHAVWMKVIAAREAREHLYRVIDECGKLADLWVISQRIENPQFNPSRKPEGDT